MRSARLAGAGKAMYGGLKRKNLFAAGTKVSHSGRPICFSIPNTTKIPSHLGDRGMYFHECVVERGYERISGGLRVLELTTESREAALGYGTRLTSANPMTSSRPKGGSTTPRARRNGATGGAARYGGGMIRRISRRRKIRY
jgi:hypothetical protein